MDGEDVRGLRKLLDLTQKELADKIGVSINTIQNYEKGGVIPASRQQMLITLEELAISNIEVDKIETDGRGNFVAKEVGVNKGTVYGKMVPIGGNEGNINTGTVSGHNLNLAGTSYEKIIDKDRIELTGGDTSKMYLREIASLKAEIVRLEALIKSKDETIAAKDETIKVLINK